MKGSLFIAFALLSPFFANAVTCPKISGISAPQGNGGQQQAYFTTPQGVCYNGEDISGKIKKYNDDNITGAFSMIKGKSDLFFVSIYSESKYSGRIIILNDDGNKLKELVIFQNKIGERPKDPEDSVENITINYFDPKTATLYFSADAWAQARALHALKWMDSHKPLEVTQRFVHSGDFQGVYNGMPMVSTISHDDKGAYFPSYLVRDDGSTFCAIDTRQNLWQLKPTCLSPDDDYRPR